MAGWWTSFRGSGSGERERAQDLLDWVPWKHRVTVGADRSVHTATLLGVSRDMIHYEVTCRRYWARTVGPRVASHAIGTRACVAEQRRSSAASRPWRKAEGALSRFWSILHWNLVPFLTQAPTPELLVGAPLGVARCSK